MIMRTAAWKADCCRLILAGLVLLVTGVASASTMPLDSVDTWEQPGTAGWGVQSGQGIVTNTGGVLSIELPAEGVPSGGSLTLERSIGTGVLVTNIAFRFRAVRVKPSRVWLRLRADSGAVWYVPLSVSAVGEWATVGMPVAYEQGWTLGAERPEAQFSSDMERLVSVEFCVLRHGDTDAQTYEIDNLHFEGVRLGYDADWDMDGMADGWEDEHGLDPYSAADALEDPDADGMPNYQEWFAGTRPHDRTSLLSLDIGVSLTPGDIEGQSAGGARGVPVLWWPSVSGRTYRLWRSTNLFNGFSPLASGIEASPDRNRFRDDSATGTGPYFYRLEVE